MVDTVTAFDVVFEFNFQLRISVLEWYGFDQRKLQIIVRTAKRVARIIIYNICIYTYMLET
jgi:hypothetical protein